MPKHWTGARRILSKRLLNALGVVWAIGVCLASSNALAASGFARIYEAHPVPFAGNKSCIASLSASGEYQVVDTVYRFQNGEIEFPEQTRRVTQERPAEIAPLVERVLNEWTEGRDYTPEQSAMLKERDRKLDPRRTTYVHLETAGSPAVVRIFDGSTRVLRGGAVWEEASASPALTPLEIGSAGYQLPERRLHSRDSSRPAYVWEIGLLNIDRQLREGVEAVLSHVSDLLDLHYNDKEFHLLGKMSSLESKKMMIYAQTRPNRVALFRRYGFQPVYSVDSGGTVQELQVAPGSVLMYAKAEDFLKLHFSARTFAKRKGAAQPDSKQDAYQKKRDSIRKHIEEIERTKLPIQTLNDVAREATALMQIYSGVRFIPGQPAIRRDLIIEFFERYLRLIVSIPENLRHSNWSQLRNLIRESLSHSTPYEGLFYFSTSMDRIASREPIQTSAHSMHAFYLTPPPKTIRLIIPTQPLAILSANPELTQK